MVELECLISTCTISGATNLVYRFCTLMYKSHHFTVPWFIMLYPHVVLAELSFQSTKKPVDKNSES